MIAEIVIYLPGIFLEPSRTRIKKVWSSVYLLIRIAAEDAACGGVLAHALQSKPNNLQIIASAASAIANLATNEKDQVTSFYKLITKLFWKLASCFNGRVVCYSLGFWCIWVKERVIFVKVLKHFVIF